MTNQESNIPIENPQELIYLASAYSCPVHSVVEERYENALRCTAFYTKQHRIIFSPIVYNHLLATRFACGSGWYFWQNIDKAFLSRSTAIWILATDGWRESVGIKAEVEIARKLGLPVFTVEETRNGYSISERTYSEIEKAVSA